MTTIDRIKRVVAFVTHVVPVDESMPICEQCAMVAIRYGSRDDDNALELCPLGRAIHDAEKLTKEARS